MVHRALIARLGFALAALVAVASLGGVFSPAVYARETPTWAAQALGQDVVNLVVAVPWLVLSSVGVHRGSRRAAHLLAGGFVYGVYAYLFYALAVHFNALFLIYCGALGVSAFGFGAVSWALAQGDPCADEDGRAPNRVVGVTLLLVAGLFAALWLSEVVPALVKGTTPPSVVEAGLFTNPAQALDLSLLLPALAVAGVSRLRRGAVGVVFAPMLLGFAVLMTAAIGGMIVVMRLRDVPADGWIAAVFAGVAAVMAVELGWLLRSVRDA